MGRASGFVRRERKPGKGQDAIFRWPSTVEMATLAISLAALASSVWAVVESNKASRESRWMEFRSAALARLSDQGNSYARAACILRVGGSELEASYFDGPIARIGKIERDLHEVKPGEDGQAARFQSLHDASRDSFRELDRAAVKYMELLNTDELERAEKICGTFNLR